MLIHYSDKITGFYTQSVDIETPEGWKPPSYATTIAPPKLEFGKCARLIDGEWVIVDDPSYTTVWDKTTKKSIPCKIEEINHETHTSIEPPTSSHVWFEYGWKTQVEIDEIEKEKNNSKILAQLQEIDFKSIRAIRENDVEWIEKYKQDAIELRSKLI